jgi:hypothetical protein
MLPELVSRMFRRGNRPPRPNGSGSPIGGVRDDLFMITCAPRTGSTLLRTYLQSHPDILCHGEVYAPDTAGALAGRYEALLRDPKRRHSLTEYRDRHQIPFLYKVVYDSQGRRAVGHKLKYDELLLAKFSQTREAIRDDADIKVIHLYRENLLERFVSWWIVNHLSGVTLQRQGNVDLTFDPVFIPAAACKQSFDETTSRFEYFDAFFAAHPLHHVSFEQLAGPDRQRHLGEILDFLHVPRRELTSELKKVTPTDLRNVVRNYAELKASFAGTEYARFFEH